MSTMSCTLFLCWISLATLLSTVVLVTDSCSSTFVGRKSKRTIEITTTASSTTTVTIPPTTSNDTTMTDSTEEDTTTKTAPKNDKTLSQDEYSHVELCEGLYKTDFCLNSGTCFIHRYRDAQIYVCDCPSHYVGQRCEEKQLEGSYGGGMKLRIRRSYRRTDKKIRRRRISHTAPPKPSRKGHHVHQRFHRTASTVEP